MVPTAIGTGDLGGATVTVPTTTETLVVSSVQVPMPNQVSLVIVMAALSWTAGTGTTSVALRLRRGPSVTGTQIGQTYTHAAVAGASNSAVMFAVDERDNKYSEQYSLTFQQAAATGNGTITSATILVITF